MRLRRHLPPVLHRRDYALLFAALLAMGLGGQMVVVAVGWQVYAIHHSAFDLGLIGLFEFLPLPILALPASLLIGFAAAGLGTAATTFVPLSSLKK